MTEASANQDNRLSEEHRRHARARSRMRVLDEDDDDPVLSAINLVDVFLVAIAILMISMNSDPLRRFMDQNLTVIRDAGKPTMEVLIQQNQKLSRFQSTGASIQGNGTKAGTAYQLSDGTMVYVPSAAESATGESR